MCVRLCYELHRREKKHHTDKESRKKCSFFSGPATKDFPPPPFPSSLVAALFKGKVFIELQKKVLFSYWPGPNLIFCGLP